MENDEDEGEEEVAEAFGLEPYQGQHVLTNITLDIKGKNGFFSF